MVCSKIYRKRGKIRWAKLSRIPPNVVFHRKTFAVPYVYNTLTMPLYKACIKIHGENFRGALENREKRET